MPLKSGQQLRAARGLLGLEKQELAELAGISPTTLAKMEAVNGPLNVRTATLRTVEQVLVERGVILLDDGSGVTLRPKEEAAA